MLTNVGHYSFRDARKAMLGAIFLAVAYMIALGMAYYRVQTVGMVGVVSAIGAIAVFCSAGALLSRIQIGPRMFTFLVVFSIFSLFLSRQFTSLSVIFTNLWLLSAGLWLAYLVSLMVREVNIVFPIALVAAIVDAWSVYYGPTSVMVRNEALTSIMMVGLPGPDTGMTIRVFGFGDVLFFLLFVMIMRKLEIFTWHRYLLLAFSLLAAGVTTLFIKGNVPGIPFMSVVLLGIVSKEMKLSREERRYIACLLGLLIFLTLIGGAFIFIDRW